MSESNSNIYCPIGYSCLSSGNLVTKAWSLCLTRAHLYCICARNGQTGLVQSNHVCDSNHTWSYWEKIFLKPSNVLADRIITLFTCHLKMTVHHSLSWLHLEKLLFCPSDPDWSNAADKSSIKLEFDRWSQSILPLFWLIFETGRLPLSNLLFIASQIASPFSNRD